MSRNTSMFIAIVSMLHVLRWNRAALSSTWNQNHAIGYERLLVGGAIRRQSPHDGRQYDEAHHQPYFTPIHILTPDAFVRTARHIASIISNTSGIPTAYRDSAIA